MHEKQKELSSLYKELILTHGAGLDQSGNVTVHGKDRINKSVELFRDGYSPRILMGGGYAAKRMKEYTVRQYSLGGDKVLVDGNSSNTAEELINARRKFLEPYKWDSIYLVSNYWHGPRITKVLAPEILKGINWEFRGAPDSRPEEEREKNLDAEAVKIVMNKIWLKAIYNFSK